MSKKIRLLLTATILSVTINSFGQNIANCIEILGTDSIKLYFKAHGILVDKECSDYYRLAKLDHNGYFFHGRSRDYYSSGQLAVDCSYQDNFLDGKYASFYSDGQRKEAGQFSNGVKVEEWRYWHENGQLKKIIIFKDQDYFLKELYKENGKQLVSNGNGQYVSTDLPPRTTIKGEIIKGRQHGKWTIYDQFIGAKTGEELFENGKFVQGRSITMIPSMNNDYFDYPRAVVDLTHDLLFLSNSSKINCIKYGAAHGYHMPRYNSEYGDLPFYNYLYQNFDPPNLNEGYILAGFTIDTSGKPTNISLHSTLSDKSVEQYLLRVLNSSEVWDPQRHNGKPEESTLLFVFQFYNGTYKILGDSRNSFPSVAVEYSAQFSLGFDSLTRLIETRTELPREFFEKGFNSGASISFHIDESGNFVEGAGEITNQLRVTKEEQTLYYATLETFKKLKGAWKPATTNDAPVKHYFNGIFTIRNGKPKFRLLSNNWVLK